MVGREKAGQRTTRTGRHKNEPLFLLPTNAKRNAADMDAGRMRAGVADEEGRWIVDKGGRKTGTVNG